MIPGNLRTASELAAIPTVMEAAILAYYQAFSLPVTLGIVAATGFVSLIAGLLVSSEFGAKNEVTDGHD